MIERVELKHEVKFFGKEYSVKLYNNADFTTAFETLKLPLGAVNEDETPVVEFDNSVYNDIFIEDGDRVVHFYSDEDKFNEGRKEFVDSVLSNHDSKKILVFLVIPENTSLMEISDMLDGFDEYKVDCYISVITSSKKDKTSVRIIMGS